MFASPPSKSVRLPNAVRLERAFSAPGFVNNWARGIADARVLFEVAEGDDVDDDDDDAVKAV